MTEHPIVINEFIEPKYSSREEDNTKNLGNAQMIVKGFKSEKLRI